jgi:hypothetical protein
MPTLTTKAPARRRLRRIAGLFVVLLGLVAAYVAYDQWQVRRAWRAACAEADRLDPGWRWDDLVAKLPAVPDEQNSAARMLAVRRLLPANWPHGTRFGKPLLDARGTPPQHRLAPDMADGLRAGLDSVAPAVTEARALADCPTGRIALADHPLIDSQRGEPFEYLRVVRDLLCPILIRQAEAGELDEALVTARAMVYAARPLADSPSLLNVLIAVAERSITAWNVERILAQGEPSPAALDVLRRVLEPEVDRPLMLNALRGQRAFIEHLVRALDEGRMTIADVVNTGAFSESLRRWTGQATVDNWINYLLGGGFSRADAATDVEHLTWMIERLKESPDGLQARAADWDAVRGQMSSSARTRMGYLARYVSDLRIDEAPFRCAPVALAAERFRQARGRWPAALGELVPEYLTAVPRDPQDLRPLRLARLADGIAIYSVGPDGKDDGGDVTAGQVGPGRRPGRDVGLRLWDPDQRRRPPP